MSSYSVAQGPRRRILRGNDGGRRVSAASFIVPMAVPDDENPGAPFPDRLDAARRSGYDEGYRAALDEVAAAEATGRAAQMRRMADALVQTARAVTEARVEAVQVAATEAVELAFQLTEAIVQRELEVGPGVVDAVRRAVALAPEDQDLEVRVNPDDPIDPAELESIVPGALIKVLLDQRVERGGCIVTAGPCRIDAQIGPALERARDVIAELYPSVDRSAPRSGEATAA
jgi:flagellar assembly protein FliH